MTGAIARTPSVVGVANVLVLDAHALPAGVMYDIDFVCGSSDIALSLQVKTLTLPAIETAEEAEAT